MVMIMIYNGKKWATTWREQGIGQHKKNRLLSSIILKGCTRSPHPAGGREKQAQIHIQEICEYLVCDNQVSPKLLTLQSLFVEKVTLLVLEAAFTRSGLSLHHQGRTMVMFRKYLVHRGPRSRRRFAAQAKPVWFGSAGASALHTLPFGFNPVDARDKSLVGRGVLITPPLVGPFCRPVGAPDG